MFANTKFQFIQFHIPKTAGSNIKRNLFTLAKDILTQAGWDKDDLMDVDEWIVQPDDSIPWHTIGIPDHDPIYHVGSAARSYLIEIIGTRAFDKYLKFASIRNPFDRIASAFDHMNYNEHIAQGFKEWVHKTLSLNIDSIQIDNFELFVKFLYDGDKAGFLLPLFFKPQTEWFTDMEGNKNIDIVICYENLQEDYEKVCDLVGYPKTILPYSDVKFHESAKRHYSKYFIDNEGCEEMVKWLYKHDFEQLGYDTKLTYS